MLNPNHDRLDYGQILSPPEGYALDFAVGTTFSLDLDALVGASIALGLAEETDSSLMNNPICLLEALRITGDKVALFCEGGQIHLPNKVSPLYILLEKMVFQVHTAKAKGIAKYPAFHPKFWLIRYLNDEGSPLYRVIVLSRNLTFDRSWDVTFAMDGTVNGRKTLKTAPVVDFLQYLAKSLPDNEQGKEKLKHLKVIMKELPYVHFSLDSKEFEDFEFLPIGVKNSKGGFYNAEADGFYPLFEDTFHEIIVMSPFLSGSIIRDFNDRNQWIKKTDYMLFTRAMSLSKLSPEDCSNFRIFTMKDAVIDGEDAISEELAQTQKQDIHAKVYMVRKDSNSYLYLGSLNASHNAVYGNVEFMMRLKSKKRYLNMKTLSESLFNGDENNPANPFQEITISSQVAIDEEQEKKNLLNQHIKALNRLHPTAKVTAAGDGFDVEIEFPSYEKKNFSVTISPLLSKKTEEVSEKVIFRGLQLTQLSEFYQITVSDGVRNVSRVILIPTEGLPEDREKAVIKSVVNDKQAFYQYVALLLGDSAVMSALESANANGSTSAASHHQMAQLPSLYEKMLKIAATNPERLKEIGELIAVVSEDGVIPEDFVQLYNTFKKVVKIND